MRSNWLVKTSKARSTPTATSIVSRNAGSPGPVPRHRFRHRSASSAISLKLSSACDQNCSSSREAPVIPRAERDRCDTGRRVCDDEVRLREHAEMLGHSGAAHWQRAGDLLHRPRALGNAASTARRVGSASAAQGSTVAVAVVRTTRSHRLHVRPRNTPSAFGGIAAVGRIKPPNARRSSSRRRGALR